MFDVEAKPVVDTHVLVRDPNQREQREKISSPVRQKQFVTRNQQSSCRNVVAEAIFARKEIKEFPPGEALRLFAFLLAILPGFAKYFFMRDRPRDTRDRNTKNKKPYDLQA
jgi:hypothetical protein